MPDADESNVNAAPILGTATVLVLLKAVPWVPRGRKICKGAKYAKDSFYGRHGNSCVSDNFVIHLRLPCKIRFGNTVRATELDFKMAEYFCIANLRALNRN